MTPQRLPGFPGRAWAAQKEALGTPSLEPGGTGAQRRPAAGTGPDAPPLCALILHGEAARPCSGKSPLLATPRVLCLLPSVGRPRGSDHSRGSEDRAGAQATQTSRRHSTTVPALSLPKGRGAPDPCPDGSPERISVRGLQRRSAAPGRWPHRLGRRGRLPLVVCAS